LQATSTLPVIAGLAGLAFVRAGLPSRIGSLAARLAKAGHFWHQGCLQPERLRPDP
jgi:hypothetical protein